MNWGYGGYSEYVPVGVRIANAHLMAAEIAAEQGRTPEPLRANGKKLAKTFWGNAWCEHVECFSDYASRLPRGKTYLRNGSVTDFFVQPGTVEAVVAGSETYQVSIEITKLAAKKWKTLCDACSGEINSLIDLLAGEFSDGVMQMLSDRKTGLFPSPKEMSLSCTCPDGAYLCKHAAAVLYGVGAKLDTDQALLFLLRAVDHNELVSNAVSVDNLDKALQSDAESLDETDLSDLFGIELTSLADLNIEVGEEPAPKTVSPRKKKVVKKKKKTTRKKATGKKKRATSAKAAEKTGKKAAPKKKKAKATKRKTRRS
ncbi:MAG: SWIM zinc finger family protein [Planctomycetaceae bacterium]